MSNEGIFWRLMYLLSGYRGRDIYIQTHDFPDPDALGAAFGLQSLLAASGVTARIMFNGKVDKLGVRKMAGLLDIGMSDYKNLEHGMAPDAPVVLVDCQKGGGNVIDAAGDEVACIDHHPACTDLSQYGFLYHRVTGSCCTLVSELYRDAGIDPGPLAAAGLLFGLKSDTADFSRGVTEADVAAYAYLFRYADKNIMHELEKNALEFSDLKAYGEAIRNVEIYGRTGFAGLGFPCPDALVALVADFLLDIEEIDVAVVWSWRKDGAKFSIRSEDPAVDAGVLARDALSGIGNGGGHAGMAGGFAPVPFSNRDRFEALVRERFLARSDGMRAGRQ